MKVISASNFFALLCFLTIGFHFETALGETRGECIAAKRLKCTTPAGANELFPNGRASTSVACTSAEVSAAEGFCEGLSSGSSGECRSLLNEYDEAMEKVSEECSRLSGVTSPADCQSRARSCASGTNVMTSENGWSNLLMAGLQMNSGASQSSNGCMISDDDKAAREKERLDDRISRLREQIADDKEDANKADEDLNKKRREVEEDMAKVEEDFNKKQIERQTKNQENAAALQKQILEAEKRRRNNANQIADKTVQMANIAFDQQQTALEFAQARVTAACDQRVEAMKEQKTMTTVNGQRRKKNLTAAQANQIKRMLEAEQESCYREVALGQQKKNKELLDKKNKMQREIDELEASSADENKAIENQRKSLDEMKAIMEQEEAKELEVKMKKLDTLNKSVTDMEASVQRKKQIIAEKILSREQDIQRLAEQKNNVQQRFAQVSNSVNGGSRAARNFVSQCCGTSSDRRNPTGNDREGYASQTATGFAGACRRITSEYDVRPSRSGTAFGGSGTGR